MNPDLLLGSATARRLYHEVARHQPIIDYHTHLDPKRLATRHRFQDLTEAWLDGDHYKWRAMRAAAIPEAQITGVASPRDRFAAWASTVPQTVRSPLHVWARLELQQLGIVEDLHPGNAEQIWTAAQERLAAPDHDAAGLLQRCGFAVVCTTDDPVDDLVWHAQAQAAGLRPRMLPTWRPDRAMGIDQVADWNAWVDRLAVAAGRTITTRDDLVVALSERRRHFANLGCRLSDHGLERMPTGGWDDQAVARTVAAARRGETPDPAVAEAFRAWFLDAEGEADHASGWVSQLHLGALRNVNERMRHALGANIGCDTIGDAVYMADLAAYFDRLDRRDCLPMTILYNLHPGDGEPMACLAQCFRNVQYGAAWWFHDHERGISRHLDIISDHGLFARWVGMLTDSRSFLSGSRHEYFRRVLCDVLGRDAERGVIPMAALDRLVIDLCHDNAERLFGFGART